MRATINFYLTWKCNFTCAHCIHECGPQGNHMTDNQLEYGFGFIRWLLERWCPIAVVGTTGGEATLHPLFWSSYMPRLKHFKQTIGDIFELHTNGSQPVPPEEKRKYQKFFCNTMIGHDMCHRMFAPMSELHLQDYTDISQIVQLRQNEYFIDKPDGTQEQTMYIRKKGRAATSMDNGFFEVVPTIGHPKLSCSWHEQQRSSDCLHFTFTPDHINHCGEKSHPLPPLPYDQGNIDEGQFHPYDMDYNKLFHAALDFNTKYSGPVCSQKCMTYFVKKTK